MKVYFQRETNKLNDSSHPRRPIKQAIWQLAPFVYIWPINLCYY